MGEPVWEPVPARSRVVNGPVGPSGFVAVYLSCSPEKLDAAVGAVRDELAKVLQDGVTADELARAKSYLVGSHQIAMQRRSAIANAIAYHEAYGLGWTSWAGYDDAIRGVTLAEVAWQDDEVPLRVNVKNLSRARGKGWSHD